MCDIRVTHKVDNAFGILLFIETELFENQFCTLHEVNM
jgi:hypothetical protein